MFSLENQTALLSSVNARAELHGQDREPACDLKFTIKAANDLLSEFHPRLKSSFYWRDTGVQADELFETPGHLPNLVFPSIGPVSWDKEFAGYTVTIDCGIDAKSNVVLKGCELNNFKFEMQDGGTVIVTFRAQCHPTEQQVGKLCYLIQSEISITLTPPDEPADLRAA